MKLFKYINESREALIKSLRHLEELPKFHQASVVSSVSLAIKELDSIEESIPKDTDSKGNKLMVLRLAPEAIKGTKISGYLETFKLPTTIPDIAREVEDKYGGGKFQIRVVDAFGKYVKSKTFEIAGFPKIPGQEVEPPEGYPTSNYNGSNL
mgnify:CR=1 FL=1|jgi:hypothetical protein